MPPHLHPRSQMTFSIFVTTLLASFVVVTIPHVLPCPAPRVAYTEGEVCADGKRRRRRRKCPEVATDGSVKDGKPAEVNTAMAAGEDLEVVDTSMEKRECPIPKPGGLMGRMLGLQGTGINPNGNGPTRPQ